MTHWLYVCIMVGPGGMGNVRVTHLGNTNGASIDQSCSSMAPTATGAKLTLCPYARQRVICCERKHARGRHQMYETKELRILAQAEPEFWITDSKIGFCEKFLAANKQSFHKCRTPKHLYDKLRRSCPLSPMVSANADEKAAPMAPQAAVQSDAYDGKEGDGACKTILSDNSGARGYTICGLSFATISYQ